MLANPCFYDAMRSFFRFFLFNQIGVASWFGNGSGTADNRQKSATFRGWFYSFHLNFMCLYFREIDYRVNLNRRDILIQFSFFSSKSAFILGGIFIGVQKGRCCSRFSSKISRKQLFISAIVFLKKKDNTFSTSSQESFKHPRSSLLSMKFSDDHNVCCPWKRRGTWTSSVVVVGQPGASPFRSWQFMTSTHGYGMRKEEQS